MKLSSLNEGRLIVLWQETNNIDEINNLFMNNYWNKIGIFVKLMRKVSMRWKNWIDFKGLHSIHFRKEDWSIIKTLIYELTDKIQELQNEINFMNDSRYFQDTESVRSGQSHVCSQAVFSLLIQSLKELSVVLWECRVVTSQVLGTRMKYRETFWQIQRRLLQHLIRKSQMHGSLMYQNTRHRMWWVKVKHKFRIRGISQIRQTEIQSSPVKEDSQKNMGQTQISELHFDKFPTSATFACWKIKFKTEICTCSQIRTEAMLWIKKKKSWLIQWTVRNWNLFFYISNLLEQT